MPSRTTPANLKPNARPVRVLSTPVYAFKDLDGEARERALEWLREGCTSDGALNGWRDSCVADLEAMGFELTARDFQTVGGSTRSEPCFFYSLSYGQDQHVGFAGRCDLSKLAAFDAKKHAPDGDLPGLSAKDRADLRALLKADPSASASLGVEYAQHNNHTRPVLEYDEDAPIRLRMDVGEALNALVRDLCHAFLKRGYEELDYLGSEESCAESAEANGYTFTAEGDREG